VSGSKYNKGIEMERNEGIPSIGRYVHIYMDVCIYKNNIDKLSEFLLRVRSLELYLSRNFLKKNDLE